MDGSFVCGHTLQVGLYSDCQQDDSQPYSMRENIRPSLLLHNLHRIGRRGDLCLQEVLHRLLASQWGQCKEKLTSSHLTSVVVIVIFLLLSASQGN